MFDVALLPFVTYIGAVAFLTITPGVDTVLVIRISTMQGPAAGVAASLGICMGLLIWGMGAAWGLTAILYASPMIFLALQWAGAAYLLILGLKLIINPRMVLKSAHVVAADSKKIGNWGALRRGFLTNILNPKIGLFYASFLPQFIPRDGNVASYSILLAIIHVLLTSIWFAALIALTAPLGEFLKKPTVVNALDRVMGTVFVAFGVRLAIAARN